MTDKIGKDYQPRDVESRWYDFWIDQNLFHADEHSDKEPFCIVIPPPNVTGKLHMGHALFVTIQDMLTRWKRMQGFEALWLPGTDHAGIATQVMVERQLAKEGTNRHELGRSEFLERVWQWKEEQGGRIIEQMKVMGASCDWERERFTMDEGLSNAVKETFVKLYEEGLIFRGERLVNWDPATQTVLSDLEVEQETEQGHLWHIAYPIEGTDQKIVVATTRPETMLGDTAVAVHPDDERYTDVIGKKVLLPLTDRKIPIIADGIVADPEFGSGAVKITPAHDFNDWETGQRNQLDVIQVIDLDAKMTDACPEKYRGMTREECRKAVLEDLDAAGLLVETEAYSFMPSRSQRSGALVEPMLLPQWWVDAKVLAKPAIEAVENGTTKMIPKMWEKTYFNWMYNIRDWCISRQLWWGHQIPAWYRKDDEHITLVDEGGPESEIIVGSEAKAYVARNAEDAAEKAGCSPDDLVQDPDVLDTWFSSALWPFSTMGWPEETATLKKFYPTTVMETGFDIIFFWVARMMMMGIHFMEEVPFETVYFHAMVRDKDGNKMSKTRGNVVDPLHVIYGVEKEDLDEDELKMCSQLFDEYPEGIEAQGADALRFTLAMYAAQGRDIKLDVKRVEGYRAFLNKVWQASRFVLMNLEDTDAEAAGSSPGELPFDRDNLSLADAWILERLALTVDTVTTGMEEYQFAEAANAIYDFLWRQFCAWYIELAKPVLYDGDDEAAQQNTRNVLAHVMESILRLLHPFAPFVSEEIWQAVPRADGSPESICVAPWPEVDDSLRFPTEAKKMDLVVSIIQAIRNVRGEANVSPGKDIPELLVFTSDPVEKQIIEEGRVWIEKLAKVETMTFKPVEEQRPELSATTVAEGVELNVPLADLIDLEEEKRRLNKQLDKLKEDIEFVQKKLANDNFVQKAPQAVVAKERRKLKGYLEDREKLVAGLRRLG